MATSVEQPGMQASRQRQLRREQEPSRKPRLRPRLRCPSILIALALTVPVAGPTAASVDRNRTGAAPAVHSNLPDRAAERPELTLPSLSGVSILFINELGQLFDTSFAGHSGLASDLSSAGATLAETYTYPITAGTVAPYDIVVFSFSWSLASPRSLTGTEAQVLVDYVNNGGSLFLTGNLGSPDFIFEWNEAVNDVGSAFGIVMADDMLCDSTDHYPFDVSYDADGGVDHPYVTHFKPHPLTEGVDILVPNWASSLVVTPPAIVVVESDSDSWGDSDCYWNSTLGSYTCIRNSWDAVGRHPVVAALETISGGRVVAVGDPDWLWNAWLFDSHRRLGQNIFAWLASRAADPPGESAVVGALSASKPTVVLTHGLQPDSVCDAGCGLCASSKCIDGLWTGSEAAKAASLLVSELGPDASNVNIVQYVWEEAFQPHNCLGFIGLPDQEAYVAAWEHVHGAGLRLAHELFVALGPGYSQRIHFIGHSLGTAVNSVAAAAFLGETSVTEAQFTSLDRPDNISDLCDMSFLGEKKWGFDENYFAKVLAVARPDLTIYLDNYYSRDGAGVGDIAKSAVSGQEGIAELRVYNHSELDEPNDLDDGVFPDEGASNNHSGVHQWYRWTVTPENPVTGGPTVCDGDVFDDVPFGIDDSLDPCHEGWWWSITGPGGFPASFPAPNASSIENLAPEPAVLLQSQASGCDIECPPSPSCPGDPGSSIRITCSESSAIAALAAESAGPAAGLLVDFPVGAHYFSFSYALSGTSDGDFVTLLIDGEPVWVVGLQGELSGDSGPIPTGGRSGPTIIRIVLSAAGGAGSEAVIENFQFSFEESSKIFDDGFEGGDVHSWSLDTGS